MGRYRCRLLQPRISGEGHIIPGRMAEVSEYRCLVVGLFLLPDKGGAGYIIFGDTTLVRYEICQSHAFSAFDMEALALPMAMKGAMDRGITECCFYSDYLQLVQLLVGPQVPISVVWHARRKVLLVWGILTSCQGFNFVFTNREENVLAHNLVNLGRTGTG